MHLIQLPWHGIKVQKVVVLLQLDSIILPILLVELKWLSLEAGTDLSSSTMFTCSTLKSWLGLNHQQLVQHQVLVKVIAQFWLVPTWSSMEVSGSMMKTWKKLEERIKVLPCKNATWTTSEYWIQKHSSGLVLESVVHHQSIDLVIPWMFQDPTFFYSEDGQKLLEPDSSMNQLKKVVITSWYGLLIPCPGNVENTSAIHQQADLGIPVPPSVHTCWFLEDGSTPRLRMK